MDNTKEFITDEAFKLFLNHSYEAVSISEISQAIGFTKGALYHHFKNKEELFKSVIDKYVLMPELIADVDKISLGEFIQLSVTQTEKIIRNLFGFSLVYAPINYMSMFADAFRHYPGYAELKGDFINNEIAKTKKVIENAIKSGEIRDDINISLIATNFFSINMGLAGNLVRNNSIDDAINLLKEQNFEFYKLLKKQ
ncbi:MAG: TetR/AcrR family transcriptional regulator [Prolixibacteraceae bacterium]|jgi:AcrR family transcriptional regulator